MRACIQRVLRARVLLPDEDNRVAGEIGQGFLVLLGVGQNDTPDQARLLAKKTGNLRVFEDGQGKMNRNLEQIQGKVLVVSQFTLYADCAHGNRPGFSEAAPPEKAIQLYECFVQELKTMKIPVETGVFRANMYVELVNDGPVTLWFDTDILTKPRKKN